MYAQRISKEELEALPVVAFTGNVFVINTVAEAEAAVQALRASGCIIGFDTETRPAFRRGVVYKVALLQLSAGNTCYLFRLCKMKTLDPVRELLEDSDVVKVGLSTPDDFTSLRKWGVLEPKGFIELQHLVKSYGIEDLSLAKIYGILFRKKISKRQRLTNWESEPLSDKQIAYAALDAVACVEIYEELSRMGHRIFDNI